MFYLFNIKDLIFYWKIRQSPPILEKRSISGAERAGRVLHSFLA